MAAITRPKLVWVKWLMAAIFLGLEIANFSRIDSASHSVSDTLRPFTIQSLVLAIPFLVIFFLIDRVSQRD